ncbi:MAG: glycine cleavage system protein H [Deltaproteobacteria bacterium]|nr:glycine cleavage system protein H [Candidatus Deferrimicrobium borealis]
MKETRCPFLETKTVTFCKAFPSKMIPVDRMSSSGGLCNSCDFEECSLYSEVRGGGMGMEHVRGFHLKSGYYYHPKHLWVAPYDGGECEARVGIDDFSARLIGRVDRASVPAVGVAVKENHVCFLLHSGHRTVHLVAPADGVVKAVNPKVSADPSILNDDPYADGWIFSMQLKGDAVKGLYHENVARKWYESEVERLQRVFSSDLGMLATDGGEALTDISSRLNDAQWGKIVSQFLG